MVSRGFGGNILFRLRNAGFTQKIVISETMPSKNGDAGPANRNSNASAQSVNFETV